MFALNFNNTAMHIFYGKVALIAYLKTIKTANSTIGFVPTMGALHQGHLALMQRSLKENDDTVVSIFVNPTQFNNPEDLEKYPRTLEEDVKKMRGLSDKIILYAPSVEDIYEGQTVSQSFDFDGLENQMEGKFRPGHFNGVGTIVKRLFEIVTPTNAYFGEKDFQQLQIVKKLVEKNNLPVNIVGCPIFREDNLLAMSSRNERLTPEERKEAAIIYKTLTEAKEIFQNSTPAETIQFVEDAFKDNKRFELEYFVIADESTLLSIDHKIKDKKYRAFIAVFVNSIRLIDTISLN
ncbi:pantoate--beta-alanine ligase [Flavobacterium johnsoniae]|jgi:pantoate--beta-alanine ligase|uniref:Pantothenate synthetase n=1 Tax=Flavobacterium johnsoniae (strain ATCC 17061 / DSM 2064 / JCM 8514 / BCRC 14874 / CCUG 350202 / NBRC 14942 / NCIMB 11054 / UW101) TaxID=376686 RepID=A5FLR0_FLAJ1|nr:pantoate--beta-alanine ligase [Flavobacterium johnsoniae]ABQ03859.1 pantothenate synthetase [Flavobacterium johnsoniae UW101]OXE96271.1 pantoate--beta-alanine ligase [Flavobacterium johnsoniae UW101]WQG79276.1 pantoate--beta-alanine ligase [Flavobacterium johnsoniae UW101]SHK04892.1 pantothenate synthetase [Flavobacterium johnsoniae]